MENYSERIRHEVNNIERAQMVYIKKMEDSFAALRNSVIWDTLSHTEKQEYEAMQRGLASIKDSLVIDESIESDLEGEINYEYLHELISRYSANDDERLHAICNELEELNAKCRECEQEIARLEANDGRANRSGVPDPSPIGNSFCFYDPGYLTPNEAKVVCVIAKFLFDNPPGVSIGLLCYVLKRYIPNTNTGEIENFMRKYPDIFEEVYDEEEDEMKWMYVGEYVRRNNMD